MKFADFDVDVAAGELRRNGARVKIQDLPLRVLVVLLHHAGEVVTRDQLRAELWGAETFVDAEAGLNTAVAKLRDALGDSADQPRFVETLPKRGYRLLSVPVAEIAATAPEAGVPLPSARPPRFRRAAVLLTAVVLAAMALGAWRLRRHPPPVTIAVVLFHNETGDAAYDQLAQQLTDGTVVALAAYREYAVIGNAAILRTPRIFADIHKIGDTLRADYLVLGQLQRVDGRLLVRAHFVRMNDQTHLWAAGIPGGESDLDGLVPRGIADGVTHALGAAPK